MLLILLNVIHYSGDVIVFQPKSPQKSEQDGTLYDDISDVAWTKCISSLQEIHEDPKEDVPLAAFIIRRS